MTYGSERKVILTTDSFCSKLKRRHNAIILFAFGKITYISEAIFSFYTHTKKKEKRRNWRAKTFEQNLLEWVKGILKNERLFRFLSWIFDSLKNEPFTRFSEHYNACLSRLFRHLNNLYPKLQWQIPAWLTLLKPLNVLKMYVLKMSKSTKKCMGYQITQNTPKIMYSMRIILIFAHTNVWETLTHASWFTWPFMSFKDKKFLHHHTFFTDENFCSQ